MFRTLSKMADSRLFQEQPHAKTAMHIPTPAESINASWLAPPRASAPNILMTTAIIATRKTTGISDTHQEGSICLTAI